MSVNQTQKLAYLRTPKWVHCLFLFALVLGKMKLSHAKLCSLDTFLFKNVIIFSFFLSLFLVSFSFFFSLFFLFLKIKFQNGAHLKKGNF